MSTKTLMTVEQFAQLKTADIRDFVVHLMRNYFEGNSIGRVFGEIHCRVPGGAVRRPDVSIFLGEQVMQIDPDQLPAPFAPDIPGEVFFPSDKAVDVHRRTRDYLRAGSKEVWHLDHANCEVVVHTGCGVRILEGTDVLESPLLPGFSAAVADLVMNI